jgi:hypothetical protein
VALRQPLLQAGRHQQHLLAITANEVLGHTAIVLNPPDATPRDYATATLDRSTEAIGVYDEVVARFGDANDPAPRMHVATALVNKGATLDRLVAVA